MKRSCRLLWFGVLASACADANVDTDPDTSTSSSGGSEIGAVESESGSTASVDATEGGADESSTAAGSTTGTPDPMETCRVEACERDCSFEGEMELEGGGVCECTTGVFGFDYVACELPPICGESHLCRMQALRYGIAGVFVTTAGNAEGSHAEAQVEILGDGRARVLTSTQEHTCCSGAAVESMQIEGYPVNVRPAIDTFWQECLAEIPDRDPFAIPDCYRQLMFGLGECQGPLEACPDVEAHVPGCDADCPMAGDGVCDDPNGTGLCAADCDPVDCACPDDVDGECDEIGAGGACPFGSDADDCPG